MNSELKPSILRYHPTGHLQKPLISNRFKAFQRNSKLFKAKYLTHLTTMRHPARPQLFSSPSPLAAGLPSRLVKPGQTKKRRGRVVARALGFLWSLAVVFWNFPPLPTPSLRCLAPRDYGNSPPEKILTPIKIKQCILLNLCYALTI